MKNKFVTVLSILIVLTTLFIFSNSLKNGEQSMQTSDSVVSFIRPLIEKLFGKDAFDLSFAVRKAGHLIEFCVLGVLTFILARRLGKVWYGYAFFYVLSVAVSDEFIQSFTGRTSMVSDVLIDFFGALVGFAFVLVFKRRKHIIINK